MVDVVLLLAVGLLVAGVVGSVLPAMPGALLSLVGVYLYWWHTGFTTPGPALLVALTLVGLFTMAVDYLGGAISARVGGASLRTTALAAVVGLVLFFVAGPLGILVGIAATVFLAEYYRSRDARASGRAAVFATVGVLASTVAQVLLTASMLVAFVASVVV
jgi:uncharacterized protein YqgC (DUF456 family)